MRVWALMGWAVLMGSGCTPQRYCLRDLQDYSVAMQIVEQHGGDTSLMQSHFREMVQAYSMNPQKDDYAQAAKESADASAIAASAVFAQALKPEPYVPPMTFSQWQGR